jgi:hypothetical protein
VELLETPKVNFIFNLNLNCFKKLPLVGVEITQHNIFATIRTAFEGIEDTKKIVKEMRTLSVAPRFLNNNSMKPKFQHNARSFVA